MNAELLLAHYERIAEAPDAIARLRRFVLDLAVRGKLAAQNPSDEPASELIARTSLEKSRRTRPRGRSDAAAGCGGMINEPFPIPDSWQWSSLGDVADLVRGVSFPASAKASEPVPGYLPCLRSGNVQSEMRWNDLIYVPKDTAKADQIVNDGDILISIANSYELVGKCAVVMSVPFEATFGAFLAAIRVTELCPKYVQYFLSSAHSAQAFRRGSSQTTNIANITFSTIREHAIPIAPLAEQHRIVAKVDELMALCDRLEAARTAREATRDRLAAASLARLNTPDPETFPSDARFALAALPALTTRPDQIKQLRQTILNLAVRGTLVPQDQSDESASALIARIGQHWKRHGASHRREGAEICNQPPQKELPYPAPPSWGWLRAEALAKPGHTITYGILKPEWVEDGIPTVRVSEMKTGSIDVAALPRCDPKRAAKFAKTTLAEGDLLISKDGTIGKTAFVPAALAGGNITQHVLRFSVTEEVDRHFVKLVIDGPPYQAQLAGETKGVALQGVNVGDFRRMALPVPPLAEQRRIVAKVNELMSLCDALEASLAAATTARTRLLEATLAEALAPALGAAQDIAA